MRVVAFCRPAPRHGKVRWSMMGLNGNDGVTSERLAMATRAEAAHGDRILLAPIGKAYLAVAQRHPAAPLPVATKMRSVAVRPSSHIMLGTRSGGRRHG